MNNSELELRPLRDEDEKPFKRAVEEFKNETPPWGFAFQFDSSARFSSYVRKLENWSRGSGLPERFVPNSFYVGVVAGEIVGRISLRHRLNDFLARIGGHIGYGVIPSQQRRGFATQMLRASLPICAGLGIEKALVTCDVDNVGSKKVIENCGGIFEGISDCPELEVQKRRYWIYTNQNGNERA